MSASKVEEAVREVETNSRFGLAAISFGTFLSFLADPTELRAASFSCPSPQGLSEKVQDSGNNIRVYRDSESSLTIPVGDETWEVPIRHAADSKVEFMPLSLSHFKVNSMRNDTIFGLDYTSQLNKIGIKVCIATSTRPLLELAQLTLENDKGMQKKLDINAAEINVKAEQLIAVGGKLLYKGDVVAECFRDSMKQFNTSAGFFATLYLPVPIAQELIASPSNNPDFIFVPFIASNGMEVQRGTHSSKGWKNLATQISSMLANQNGELQRENILQSEVNKICEVVRIHLRSEIYAEGAEVLALIDQASAKQIRNIFQESTLNGAAATKITAEPEYKAMMSSWLEALKQECRITDSKVVYNEVVDGHMRMTIDTDKIIDMITQNNELAPVWGFLGAEQFQKMSGKERENTIVNKVLSNCKNSTGTTFVRSEDNSYFEVHSVKVNKLTENLNEISIEDTTYITLAKRPDSTLRKAREFGLGFTDLAINAAVHRQIAELRKEQEQVKLQAQNAKEEAERLQKRLSDQERVKTLLEERNNAIKIGYKKVADSLGKVADYNEQLGRVVNTVPAVAKIIYDSDQAICVSGGRRQGYNEVRDRMLAWKGEKDAGEKPLAERFWNSEWYDGLCAQWHGTISAQCIVRDSARKDMATHRSDLKVAYDAVNQEVLDNVGKELLALKEIVIRPISTRGIEDATSLEILGKANQALFELSKLLDLRIAHTEAVKKLVRALGSTTDEYFDKVNENIAAWAAVTENELRREGRRMAVAHGHIALHDDRGGRDDDEANLIKGCMEIALQGKKIEVRFPFNNARLSSNYADEVANLTNNDLNSHGGLQSAAKDLDVVRDAKLKSVVKGMEELGALLEKEARIGSTLRDLVVSFDRLTNPVD